MEMRTVQHGLWKAFEELSHEALVSGQDLGRTSGRGEAEAGWADRASRKDPHRRNPIWNRTPSRYGEEQACREAISLYPHKHFFMQVARGANPTVVLSRDAGCLDTRLLAAGVPGRRRQVSLPC